MINLSKIEKLTLGRVSMGTLGMDELFANEKKANTINSLLSYGLIELAYPEQECASLYKLSQKGKRILNKDI